MSLADAATWLRENKDRYPRVAIRKLVRDASEAGIFNERDDEIAIANHRANIMRRAVKTRGDDGLPLYENIRLVDDLGNVIDQYYGQMELFTSEEFHADLAYWMGRLHYCAKKISAIQLKAGEKTGEQLPIPGFIELIMREAS